MMEIHWILVTRPFPGFPITPRSMRQAIYAALQQLVIATNGRNKGIAYFYLGVALDLFAIRCPKNFLREGLIQFKAG